VLVEALSGVGTGAGAVKVDGAGGATGNGAAAVPGAGG
jgi:hypothetical protein